jgi:2-(1,2-epoxy-1,2-dihydrophenyl)acetyl-CoA isomerase
MGFNEISLEVSDSIATLTLACPRTLNGLSVTMTEEFLSALRQIQQRTDVDALIVTGTGKAFCAGANLAELQSDIENQRSLGEVVEKAIIDRGNPLILALQNFPRPVIAAVNGVAAGGGMGLALAADIVIAGRSAYFQAPFLPRLGIVPDMGSSWFLPRNLGRGRAMGLILLGERLSAATAADWGLIWSCVEDEKLMKEARKIASRLGNAPSHTALEARHAVAKGITQGLEPQLDYERIRQRQLGDLPSLAEGIDAFMEKREPMFKR